MIPEVSVIVTVYNTEKYLVKCLDSLVKQSLKNIEIIVVNDGSTDGSQKVINNYLKKYPRKITAIIKRNEGPGIARNSGIKLARGDYLGFVDSDDWVAPNMFCKLYEAANEEHDFILCDYVELEKKQKNILKGFTGKMFNHSQAVMYSTDAAFSCNKLIKKSLFDSLSFTNGWYEDLATIPILLTKAGSPTYVNQPLYYYKKRSNSITNSNHIKTLGVIRAWERLLSQSNPQYRQEIVFAVAKNIVSFLKFKPKYASKFMEFAFEHHDTIASNIYYQEAIRLGELNDLFALTTRK